MSIRPLKENSLWALDHIWCIIIHRIFIRVVIGKSNLRASYKCFCENTVASDDKICLMRMMRWDVVLFHQQNWSCYLGNQCYIRETIKNQKWSMTNEVKLQINQVEGQQYSAIEEEVIKVHKCTDIEFDVGQTELVMPSWEDDSRACNVKTDRVQFRTKWKCTEVTRWSWEENFKLNLKLFDWC